MSPWMENGNVLDYLRENHEANPVKLVSRPRPHISCLTLAQLEESALGLQYLHEVGIVHGDLQGVRLPQIIGLFRLLKLVQRHILVTDDGHACLANVGHANIVREQGDSVLATVSTTVDNSNLRYLAPEHYTLEAASKLATKQGDIYSMGMTIYEVHRNTICTVHPRSAPPRSLPAKSHSTSTRAYLSSYRFLMGRGPESPTFSLPAGTPRSYGS